MRKIGYARVSSADENLDRQIAALISEGCDPKDIYREKASGKSLLNRPELEKAIDRLGTGDCLVVAEWDRATRSMMDGIAIIDRIKNRGSLLKVLDRSYLDLTTEIGCGIIAFLSALAADERKRMRWRQEGRPGPRREVRAEAQAVRAPASGGSQAACSGRKRPDHRQVVRGPSRDGIIGGGLKRPPHHQLGLRNPHKN
jgi:DNA invertase Pin-like site-specific DNA recombinase